MKFYELDDGEKAGWHGTQADAHAEGKKTPPVFRGAIRITEVDIGTDKDGVLFLLTTGAPKVRSRGRVWKISARGGLRPLQEGA